MIVANGSRADYVRQADQVMTGSGEIVFYVSYSVLSSKVAGFVASDTLAQLTLIKTRANSAEANHLDDRKRQLQTVLIKLIPGLLHSKSNLWDS